MSTLPFTRSRTLYKSFNCFLPQFPKQWNADHDTSQHWWEEQARNTSWMDCMCTRCPPRMSALLHFWGLVGHEAGTQPRLAGWSLWNKKEASCCRISALTPKVAHQGNARAPGVTPDGRQSHHLSPTQSHSMQVKATYTVQTSMGNGKGPGRGSASHTEEALWAPTPGCGFSAPQFPFS